MVTNTSIARLGLVRKNLEGHASDKNYTNQLLQENKFTDLDQLTEDHVEGVNFSNLFENTGIWFSST